MKQKVAKIKIEEGAPCKSSSLFLSLSNMNAEEELRVRIHQDSDDSGVELAKDQIPALITALNLFCSANTLEE